MSVLRPSSRAGDDMARFSRSRPNLGQVAVPSADPPAVVAHGRSAERRLLGAPSHSIFGSRLMNERGIRACLTSGVDGGGSARARPRRSACAPILTERVGWDRRTWAPLPFVLRLSAFGGPRPRAPEPRPVQALGRDAEPEVATSPSTNARRPTRCVESLWPFSCPWNRPALSWWS